MAINLFGDPYNLQGGSGASLQPAGNPQQAAGLYGPPSPQPQPTRPGQPVRTVTPKSVTTISRPSIPTAQPDRQINSFFSPFIDSRPSAVNPGTLEYYKKQGGQGFSSEQELYNYASSLGAGTVNSVDQLHAPINGYQAGAQNAQLVTDPNQNIASNAGLAGLSPADYLSLIQNQNKTTPEELSTIQQGLGIPDLLNQTFLPPQQSSVDFYNQLYGSAGLADVRQKIQDLNDQVSKRQQDFLDAQGTINENPFLSEASRVGRVSRLNDKAQAEINNLLNEQQQYQTLYQNGLNEINNHVQLHTNDFTQNQQLNAQKLQVLLQQAEAQSTALQSQKQQSALSYLPAYLQSKAKSNTQQTVTAPNGAVLRYNPSTGTYETIVQPGGNYDQNTITGDIYSKNTGQTLGSGSISIPAGTLAAKNNNPGNIRYVGQAGATQGAGGFAAFATPEAGYQALVADLQGKMTGNTKTGLGPNSTLADLINVYAPPSENNTSQYIQQAATALGLPASTKLSQIDVNQLAQFIAKKESGSSIGSASSGAGTIDSYAQGLVDGTRNPDDLSPRDPAYKLILDKADAISMQQTGHKFDAVTAAQNFKAKQQALNQSATDFRTLQLANSTALDHLDQLISLSAAAKRTDSPIANDALLYAKGAVQGDKNYTSYLSTINVVRAEVAKVLGGGQTTVESLNEAKSVLPDNLGHNALIDAIKNVKQLMAAKIKEYSSLSNVAQYGGSTPSGGSNVDLSKLNFSF